MTAPRLALTALAILAASGVAASPSVAAPAQPAPCKPHNTTISGRPAVKFCGPAVAAVKANGIAYSFRRGNCVRQGSTVFVQIGVIGGPTVGTLQRESLFYILTDARAPSKGALLYWITAGKRYRAAPGARITVTPARIAFTGKLATGAGVSGAGAFSGTVTCQ